MEPMTVERTKELNGKYQIYLVDMVEDDREDLQLVEELLDKSGLTNRRTFATLGEYEATLRRDPLLTPHIALLDYQPSIGSTLTGYTIMRMLVTRSTTKRLTTKCIMVTGHSEERDIRKFFHNGGYAWLNKNDREFRDELTEIVIKAIAELKEAMEELESWKDLKEDNK
jgi:CheY-like chemotaxis protein